MESITSYSQGGDEINIIYTKSQRIWIYNKCFFKNILILIITVCVTVFVSFRLSHHSRR